MDTGPNAGQLQIIVSVKGYMSSTDRSVGLHHKKTLRATGTEYHKDRAQRRRMALEQNRTE